MSRDKPENFEEIERWAQQRSWTLGNIREFYENTSSEDFPIPERLGVRKIPTKDTYKYFCRYW